MPTQTQTIWPLVEIYSTLVAVPASALGLCAFLSRRAGRLEDTDAAQLVRIGIRATTGSVIACLAVLGTGVLPRSWISSLPALTLLALSVGGAFAACTGLVLTAWNGRGLLRVGGVLLSLFSLALTLLFGLGLMVAPG